MNELEKLVAGNGGFALGVLVCMIWHWRFFSPKWEKMNDTIQSMVVALQQVVAAHDEERRKRDEMMIRLLQKLDGEK